MASVSIERKGVGLEPLKALTNELEGSTSEAGVLAPEASRTYDGSSGPSVAYVAAIHEYGWGAVPERAFMARAVEQDARAWAAPTEDAIRAVSRGATQGRASKAVIETAESAARSIHRSLQTTRQWADEESSATQERKGFSWPLHDTLQLSYSISGRSMKNGTETGKVKV